MSVRFPLYLKFLGWFGLNLVLLCGVGLGLVWSEVRVESLLASVAGERVQGVARLLAEDLRGKSEAEWSGVLELYGTTHGVSFAVVDDQGGTLAGNLPVLPERVRARFRPPGEEREGGATPRRGPGFGPGPGPRGGRMGAGPGVVFVRSTDPTRWWALVRTPPEGMGREGLRGSAPGRGPLRILMMSESLTGGGFFLDPRPWWMAAAGVLVLSVLWWFPFVRGMTRSIGRMTEATGRMADGRFDVRVGEVRRDELGVLGSAIDRMAGRLDGFVGGQRRFLGDIAHELCAPVSRIQVALGIIEQRADERQRGYVQDLREEVEHMSGLVNELLSFSKASLDTRASRREKVSLREAMERAVKREETGGVDVRVEAGADVAVMGDMDLLVRAIGNLVRNAVRYAGGAGPVRVVLERSGSEAWVTVLDEGPGVPPGEIGKLFDPFYRVDTSRTRQTGGVGLGLTIVKTCVDACGGAVEAMNREPRGLAVRMRFPLLG